MLKISSILIILSCSVSLFAKLENPDHLRMHERSRYWTKVQGLQKLTKEDMIKRRMQGGSWRKLKVYFDLTGIHNGFPSRRSFYDKVFDLTANWLNQALWVKDDKSKILPYINRRGRNNWNYPSGYDLYCYTTRRNNTGNTLIPFIKLS